MFFPPFGPDLIRSASKIATSFYKTFTILVQCSYCAENAFSHLFYFTDFVDCINVYACPLIK